MPIEKLKAHEAVNPKHVGELVRQLRLDRCFKSPVVADKKTLVVLDGHHRLAAGKKLGLTKIPVYLVNYFDVSIRVYLRRKKMNLPRPGGRGFFFSFASLGKMDIQNIKNSVIDMGLSNNVFPKKTTRHLLPYRPRQINVPLEECFRGLEKNKNYVKKKLGKTDLL